jgi:hypothetical protein
VQKSFWICSALCSRQAEQSDSACWSIFFRTVDGLACRTIPHLPHNYWDFGLFVAETVTIWILMNQFQLSTFVCVFVLFEKLFSWFTMCANTKSNGILATKKPENPGCLKLNYKKLDGRC